MAGASRDRGGPCRGLRQYPSACVRGTPTSVDEPRPGGESLRARIGARGEEAIGKIAQDLLENTWVNSALTAALEARGRAAQAQEVAMEFLNLPSAAQIERLTRRVRSVSQRLESIEDTLSRLEDGLRASPRALAARLDAIEQQLAELTAQLTALRSADDGPATVSRDQERLRVEDAGHPDADSAALGGAGAGRPPIVGGAG